MIRVSLVAPSPALRAGLRLLLSADAEISVVAEVSNLDAATQNSEAGHVLITTRAASELVLEGPPPGPDVPSVLFLSDAPLDIRRFVGSSPPWGVLPIDASATQLCAAVHALAAGLVVGSPELMLASDVELTPAPLTDRESEVLGLLSEGLANKQIAIALGISEHTVKFHVSSIYTKLNATNRTQAVREGLRNGWIAL